MLFEGKKPAGSLSAVRAVLRLTQLRCWVVPGRDSSSSASSVRRVPSLHSAVRLRRVQTCLLFLHTSAGKNPAGSVPGRQDTAVRIRSRLLAQTVSGFRFAAPATDCAGGMVPGLTAASLLPSIREWAVPSQTPEGVCPPTTSVSSAVPGSLASPFHGAPEPAVPHASRHPPGPRSTSFRALGYWETLSRAAAWMASRTGTTSHASPTRLRDSQQPRPTRKLTPQPQCVIHRHHPPDEGEKGINIYNGSQRLAPLRVLKYSAVRVPIAIFNLLKINLLMSIFFTILYIVLKTYYYENTVT